MPVRIITTAKTGDAAHTSTNTGAVFHCAKERRHLKHEAIVVAQLGAQLLKQIVCFLPPQSVAVSCGEAK